MQIIVYRKTDDCYVLLVLKMLSNDTSVFVWTLWNFWDNFFASDCFSEYESLCMTVASLCMTVVKLFFENIWKISTSISASDSKFRKTNRLE